MDAWKRKQSKSTEMAAIPVILAWCCMPLVIQVIVLVVAVDKGNDHAVPWVAIPGCLEWQGRVERQREKYRHTGKMHLINHPSFPLSMAFGKRKRN